MDTKPEFSVVIATHNRRELLGRAIRSALQHDPPPEVIVVDDASTDGTAEHVRATFPSVRLHRVARGGPGPARNLGLDEARGRWAVVLDDDDELRPEALQKIARRLEAFAERDRFPAFLFRYGNGVAAPPFQLFGAEQFCNGAVAGDFLTVWNRDVARGAECRYPAVPIGAEGLMWLEIAERYGVPAWGDDVGIVHHDAADRLTSVEAQLRNAAEHARIQDRYVSFLRGRAQTRSVRRLISRRLLAAGLYNLLSGERRYALARALALTRYNVLMALALALGCCMPRVALVAALRLYRRAST